MEENSDDEFYYPDDVEDESATFFGGYEENNGENDNSQSKIEEFIKDQLTGPPILAFSERRKTTYSTTRNFLLRR